MGHADGDRIRVQLLVMDIYLNM